MHIIFGLHLDGHPVQPGTSIASGTACLGPQGLLQYLERLLGLTGYPSDTEYLRIEQFRQAIRQYLLRCPDAFFARSFEADQFGAATRLLALRDELLLGGWHFSESAPAPLRLQQLAGLHAQLQSTLPRPWPGFADRLATVLELLEHTPVVIESLSHKEPLDLLPAYWHKLFDRLEAQGCRIAPLQLPVSLEGASDLQTFKRILLEGPPDAKIPLQGDGSLLIVRASTPHRAASFLAQLLRINPTYRPLCLVTDKSRTLDDALIQEGLPSLGLPSASLARPTLQILKLAPAFLWEPIDPYKVLEFVSLALKPIQENLATVIANQIAQSPGFGSEGWDQAIRRFFDWLEARQKKRSEVELVRQQYRFWFARKRYQLQESAPKEDVVEIFDYIQRWAYRLFDENHPDHTSLLVLSEQARRIRNILLTAPEESFSALQVERIVRTIYEPSPVVFQPEESGHLDFGLHPGALLHAPDDLLWWNFLQNEPVHFFSPWYQGELDYLKREGVFLTTPDLLNRQLLWYRKHPFLLTSKRVILVVPDTVRGDAVAPHPLMGDLEASFQNLDRIHCPIDQFSLSNHLGAFFRLPSSIVLPQKDLGRPQSFLLLDRHRTLKPRENESYSSLSTLFYYPYQWVFRHKLRLRKSSILSVVDDQTLMGNLAHRLFEYLLQEDLSQMTKSRIETWIEKRMDGLLAKEGSVLLLYGREPEKVGFINRLKFAAWSLVSLIKENQWTVAGLEQSLEGLFLDVPVKGIADLILERAGEKAIIDLKWSGARRREEMIRNEEDLQLVLYAHLLGDPPAWPHTAYFVIKDGKMIARNNQAFAQINPVSPDANIELVNRQILERMETTYLWRLRQLELGRIEVRCEHTVQDLEIHYGEEDYGVSLLDLLEMPAASSRYDDYQTLINLVE